MRAKRKLLISMLAIVFVLLAVVATIAIAFALTQQTITTTLNIGYVVEDIDGTASATYTIGGVTESLTAMKGDTVIGDTLVFHAEDTEDAGNLMFPEGQIPLTAQNDNIVIQYTYSNTGERHYIASMSFDAELVYDNMKVEYSIDGTTYSENRYAVVVPANTANKSYWIKISIDNKAKSASFVGDFRWLLNGCDEQSESYLSLTSLEFTGSDGWYAASVATAGGYTGQLVFPSEVNGDPVTGIAASSLNQAQKNQVTSVYIPDSVVQIEDGAFSWFSNLKSVTFEQNETEGASALSATEFIIGAEAFCYSGLLSIEIPSNVTQIGQGVFAYCSSLTSIQVASGNNNFVVVNDCLINTSTNVLIRGCETSIVPSNMNIEEFDVGAFAGLENLTTINIPNTVNLIDAECFGDCFNIKYITIDSLNDGVVDDVSDLVTSQENIEVLTFGDNITEIPDDCFWEYNIKNLVLGKNVSSLGAFNFWGPLETVSVKEDNPYFYSAGNCLISKDGTLVRGGLKSVIPNDGTITAIGDYAFYNVYTLTSVVIPDSVNTIGEGAFNCEDGYGCNITSITLGSGLETICVGAFAGSRITELILPASLKTIMQYAFSDCSQLETVIFENTEGWTVNGASYDVTSSNEDLILDLTQNFIDYDWIRS